MLLVQHYRACKLGEPAAHLGQQMAHLEGHLRMRLVDRVGLCRLHGGGCGSHGGAPFHRISSTVWTGPLGGRLPYPQLTNDLGTITFAPPSPNRATSSAFGNTPRAGPEMCR